MSCTLSDKPRQKINGGKNGKSCFFISNPAVNTDIDGYASGKRLRVFVCVSKRSALYLTMSAQPC